MGFLDDYEPVEDRLRAFWEEHPYGRIITELISHDDGDYIVQASVYVGSELRNDLPVATGLAHDSTATLPQNMQSSALEVCETSAIGRALANMGYAPKGKRPSREEMSKVKRPEPGGEAGSGDDSGEHQGGDGAPVVATSSSSLPVPEPHEHEAGPKQLASGAVLCVYEFANGTVCGKPFKPKPTVFTDPPKERVDIS